MDWEPIYWCKDEEQKEDKDKLTVEFLKEFTSLINKTGYSYLASIPTEMSRCYKCVYEGTCSGNDNYGQCTKYKRDPPDGGYYG